jgi:hypothetical protein
MGDLRVRNVDDEVIDMLRSRATREGRSLSRLAGELLAAEAMRPRPEWSERLERLRAGILAECGELPDSTPDIREKRDRWG